MCSTIAPAIRLLLVFSPNWLAHVTSTGFLVHKNDHEMRPKVIVLAAGRGSRLKHYTSHRPKCMLPFGPKTLLEHQLAAFATNDIDKFHVVRGYCGEVIQYQGITYHENPDYMNNNVLNSLFCAESVLNGNVIVCYSDILFTADIVQALLKAEHDISIVVDTKWREYYLHRADHPLSEAEIAVITDNGLVTRIGKNFTEDTCLHGEFIGMMKLTARGAETLKSQFHSARSAFWGQPFQRAVEFQQAYITDMLQHMIDAGISVHCVTIEREWKEIDTVEDYEKALAQCRITPASTPTNVNWLNMRNIKIGKTAILAIAFLWGATNRAHAYLDPGAGNMIFQFVIAAGLAAIISVKRVTSAAKALLLGFIMRYFR